jgi:hypothetical protein
MIAEKGQNMDNGLILFSYNETIPNKYLDIWEKIPSEVKHLLYFTDEKPPEDIDKIGINMTFTFPKGIKMEKMGSRNDPSTIYFPLPIAMPMNIDNIPAPERYPKYYQLTAEQKYVYLNWLHDIDQPIPEGYRHLLLAGLQRQLLIGDFDASWEMILRLRKAVTMHDYMFVNNSENTLFTACFLFNRTDLLSKMKYLFEKGWWGDEQLLIKYYTHEPIEAHETINILNHTDTPNRRYFTTAPEVYAEEMSKLLFNKTGRSFILPEDYMDENKRRKPYIVLGFHNPSFPFELRSIVNIKIPDPDSITTFLKSIHLECHEQTKIRTRKMRSKRNSERRNEIRK